MANLAALGKLKRLWNLARSRRGMIVGARKARQTMASRRGGLALGQRRGVILGGAAVGAGSRATSDDGRPLARRMVGGAAIGALGGAALGGPLAKAAMGRRFAIGRLMRKAQPGGRMRKWPLPSKLRRPLRAPLKKQLSDPGNLDVQTSVRRLGSIFKLKRT